MDLTRDREVESLEKNLSWLGTIASTAPFVGLLGTVWGIMNSFQAIAATKNSTLAVVAPGIAEALFATALGLIAAIPALVAYNKLSGSIDSYANRCPASPRSSRSCFRASWIRRRWPERMAAVRPQAARAAARAAAAGASAARWSRST